MGFLTSMKKREFLPVSLEKAGMICQAYTRMQRMSRLNMWRQVILQIFFSKTMGVPVETQSIST